MFDFSRLASWSTWMCRHWVDARQLLQCPHLTSHQRDQGQRQTGHGCFEPNVPSQGPGPDATQVLFLCDKKYKSVKQHAENTWPRLWKSSWKAHILKISGRARNTNALYFIDVIFKSISGTPKTCIFQLKKPNGCLKLEKDEAIQTCNTIGSKFIFDSQLGETTEMGQFFRYREIWMVHTKINSTILKLSHV